MQTGRPSTIIYTVYFSGNSHELADSRMLASFFYKYNLHDGQTHIKKGYDGCGVTNGLMGTLFGSGLKEQSEEVVQEILDLIARGNRVVLNCYAHSRGAMAALMMTKKLGGFDRSVVEINLALLDPVPGNLLTTSKVDLLGISLTNQNIDLSDCHNLTNVLALYPNIPLPDFAVHAPLIPAYPHKCRVEEDIIPGCHAETQYVHEYAGRLNLPDRSFITYIRIRDFMLANGTQYNMPGFEISQVREYGSDVEALKNCYQSEKNLLSESTSRDCHSMSGTKIVTDLTGHSDYLNLHHKKLCSPQAGSVLSANDCVFRFAPAAPQYVFDVEDYCSEKIFAQFKKFFLMMQKLTALNSSQSRRKKIMNRFQNELESMSHFSQNDDCINALRNVIAVLLVNESLTLSFFSSNPLNDIVQLLKKREFKSLRNIIMGSCSGMVRYHDLTMFVTGVNDGTLFDDARYIYDLFKSEDTLALTRNNVAAYVRNNVGVMCLSPASGRVE